MLLAIVLLVHGVAAQEETAVTTPVATMMAGMLPPTLVENAAQNMVSVEQRGRLCKQGGDDVCELHSPRTVRASWSLLVRATIQENVKKELEGSS